jgi:hypothetical protein
VVVQRCTGATHPATGQCLGPPETFPGGHAGIADESSAVHMRYCRSCRATMMACWRGGCDFAGDPYMALVAEARDSATARAKGLSRDDYEEARDWVYVELTYSLLGQNAWAPENMDHHDDALTRLVEAGVNDYYTWFKQHRRHAAIGDFLVEEANGAAGVELQSSREVESEVTTHYDTYRGALAAGSSKRNERPRSHDPADIVIEEHRYDLTSPDLVKKALATISHAMTGLPEVDADFLASFMRRVARGGSLRDYCRETYGIDDRGRPRNLSTTHRRLRRIGVDLARQLGIGTEPIDDDREVALYFLYRMLEALDSDHDVSTHD